MKKHILFVDDENNILQGLKRTLRCHRHEWEVAFANSGKQALEILENEYFDAIVTDMRMPGMDGAQLLDEVKDRHPGMVRFVLSGYSDQELVMRSVGPSHQYLAKPCDPELLKAKLTSAFALHELLESKDLRTIVGGLTTLPSLPHIYRDVVEELQSPDATIMAVGKLIEQDPGMSTRVLQLVNSAYFGLGRQITSPVEAANFLGQDVLKSLVLSEGVFSQFDPKVINVLSLDTVKNHSILVAHAARAISKSEGADKKISDQAFLAGLLHDMGSMVLAANLPEEYLKTCQLVQSQCMAICDAEMQVFGTTHAEVTAYLLGLWGIDEDVVAAIAYHHKPWAYPAAQFSVLTAVYVAATCLDKTSQAEGVSMFTENGLAYLENLGLSDRIPEWQAICSPLDEDAA